MASSTSCRLRSTVSRKVEDGRSRSASSSQALQAGLRFAPESKEESAIMREYKIEVAARQLQCRNWSKVQEHDPKQYAGAFHSSSDQQQPAAAANGAPCYPLSTQLQGLPLQPSRRVARKWHATTPKCTYEVPTQRGPRSLREHLTLLTLWDADKVTRLAQHVHRFCGLRSSYTKRMYKVKPLRLPARVPKRKHLHTLIVQADNCTLNSTQMTNLSIQR